MHIFLQNVCKIYELIVALHANICQMYAEYMQNVWRIYARNMHKISAECAKKMQKKMHNIQKICKNMQKNMHNMRKTIDHWIRQIWDSTHNLQISVYTFRYL